MNKLENGVIKYQIQMEAYKNGKANEIVSLLDNAVSEIAKFIKKTDGVYTKKRYTEIARKLSDVSASLKENVGNNIDLDGIIDYELKKQKSLLNSIKPDIIKIKGGEVNFLYPTREQIKTAALFKPVTEGFTYDSYLDGIEAGLYNTWDSAVRTGYLTGQTTQQIVRNVMGGVSPQAKLKEPGAINALRNSVYGNTRTVLQSFAEETRERVYKENEQYFGDGESDYKYERLAVLDSKTCLVCANLDGKLYKTLEEAQPVIIHRGDRCILLPYFNIKGDTRASKNGYLDSKVTYEEWLSEQDEKTQKEVLGKSRFELYKSGTKINQFVDNGKILTLEELNDSLDLRPYSGEKAENYISDRFWNIENELTKEEIYSLQKYSSTEYRKINACARRGVDNGYESVVSDIASAIDKYDVGHAVTVYRGDGTDCIKQLLSKSFQRDFENLIENDPEALILRVKGKKCIDYGFTSTSLDKSKAESFADNVLLQINTKSNTKGVYLESITSHKGEKELLLGAGQYMRVRKAMVEEINGNKVLKLVMDVL